MRGARAVISSSRKTPPLARIALHEGEILRCEEHGPHDPEHITGPDLRGPVDAGTVRLAGVQLQLDQLLPLALSDLRPHDRAVGAHTDQGGVGGDPVTAQGGEVADRLDQVGLALPVGAHERGDARVERNFDPGVRAEVGQRQMRDVHGRSPTSPSLWTVVNSPVDYFVSTA
ncbi:hypothetical protein M2155_003831 [Streptomyces sp. SAI-119]|nr:hypothetical protein [Streptomyces sp. SAI-119]